VVGGQNDRGWTAYANGLGEYKELALVPSNLESSRIAERGFDQISDGLAAVLRESIVVELVQFVNGPVIGAKEKIWRPILIARTIERDADQE